MLVRDWSRYPNFSKEEFYCMHSGFEMMEEKLIFLLQLIRDELQFPLIISSGYRSAEHPIEAAKDEPGEHTTGLAVDIQIAGKRALQLVHAALDNGIQRIGISQSGPWDKRFVHLGMGDVVDLVKYQPTIWSY